MNLSEPILVLDDPVAAIFSYHRRLERQLAALARLPVHLDAHGVDAEASATAAAVLHCLGPAAQRHHEEEERELFPLLERRVALASDRHELRLLLARFEAEHLETERLARALRRPLEAIAEGLLRRLQADDIAVLRALCAAHLLAEEGVLQTLALRHLRPDDRTALGRRIRARREGAGR